MVTTELIKYNCKSPRNNLMNFVFRVWTFINSASNSNKVKTLYDVLSEMMIMINLIGSTLKDVKVIF